MNFIIFIICIMVRDSLDNVATWARGSFGRNYLSWNYYSVLFAVE